MTTITRWPLLLFSLLLIPMNTLGQVYLSDIANQQEGDIPELDCVIEPSEIVDAGSAVPGLIETIYADRSDLIKKGAVIAQLESSVEQAALARARAQAKMSTSIELRQQSVNLGSITEKRNKELLNISAISAHDMDQLMTENRIAALQVKQEKHNQHIAELEYQRAQAALDRLTIRSPVEGVVMDRFKAVGEYVEDEPVLRVAKLDPLFVEVVVPVDYLGQISAGMQAEVTPTAAGQTPYTATVERVDRVADAASGTYGVRLSLANPNYSIPAGLRCKLAFLPADTHQTALDTANADSADSANENIDHKNQQHWVRAAKQPAPSELTTATAVTATTATAATAATAASVETKTVAPVVAAIPTPIPIVVSASPAPKPIRHCHQRRKLRQ